MKTAQKHAILCEDGEGTEKDCRHLFKQVRNIPSMIFPNIFSEHVLSSAMWGKPKVPTFLGVHPLL